MGRQTDRDRHDRVWRQSDRSNCSFDFMINEFPSGDSFQSLQFLRISDRGTPERAHSTIPWNQVIFFLTVCYLLVVFFPLRYSPHTSFFLHHSCWVFLFLASQSARKFGEFLASKFATSRLKNKPIGLSQTFSQYSNINVISHHFPLYTVRHYWWLSVAYKRWRLACKYSLGANVRKAGQGPVSPALLLGSLLYPSYSIRPWFSSFPPFCSLFLIMSASQT